MSNVVDLKRNEIEAFPGKQLVENALMEMYLNTLHGLDDQACRLALEEYIKHLEENYCLTF